MGDSSTVRLTGPHPKQVLHISWVDLVHSSNIELQDRCVKHLVGWCPRVGRRGPCKGLCQGGGLFSSSSYVREVEQRMAQRPGADS